MTSGADAQIRTYYGRPVVKEPEWTWEVPWYLFFGGLAGTSSLLAAVARARGNVALARAARLVAGAGAAVSPPLLIADLGRPSRFLNMLRVFKPSSAMSVGSWILAAYSPVAMGAAAAEVTGWVPRLQLLADATGAVLGPAMTGYTAVLVADTSIPVWHEARNQLPLVFASSGAASAGAAALLLTPAPQAGPARRLAIGGAVAELAAEAGMQRRLGEIGEVYSNDAAGALSKAAKVCNAAGALLIAIGGPRRALLTRTGALALLAGGVLQRWAVYKAGFQSARDPRSVGEPQRRRLEERSG